MIETNKSLQKIRAVQNNIQSLANQIKKLGRDEFRNIQSIQRCFQECVPLIKSKIQQSKKHFKIQRLYQQTVQQKQNRILNIKLKKYDDLRRKTNVKALINSIKHKEATQIRQQSTKHQKLMKQHKLKHLQQNVKKSGKIKTSESIIKQKLKSFYLTKIQDLSRMKKTQLHKKQLRIQKSSNAMKDMSFQMQSSNQKFNQTHGSLVNLRSAIKKIKFMRPDQFSQLMNQTLNESVIEVNGKCQYKANNKNASKKNHTTMTQSNELSAPIYSGETQFSSEQKFIASKLIGKLLKSPSNDNLHS